MNLVKNGKPIFKKPKICGKINLPEVAKKKSIPAINIHNIVIL